jgi:2-isopropylmalate synthase/UPF0716 protein FxsA
MIYFILYVFLEVMVSSTISGQIGGLMTFLELIGSAIFGIFLLQNFKFSLLEKINSVRNGDLTQDEFIKSSIGAAIGAMLLIVPGFFTDILGLLLQFSLFTVVFTKIFKFKKSKSTNNTQYNNSNFSYTSFTQQTQTKQGDDDVIDVEIIDDNKSIKY